MEPNGTAESLAAGPLRGVPGPWDVFVEKIRRYEVHLAGDRIEMRRGPVELLGFGLRLFRPAGERLGIGIAAASDLGEGSVRQALANAESTAARAPSPTTKVDLPTGRGQFGGTELGILDQALWDRPSEVIESYAHALLEGIDNRASTVPSFGSVRAALVEVSIANSTGGRWGYSHTLVETEFAIKAFGGPEGPPPGEYWINRRTRAVPRSGVREEVASWCSKARDVRRAKPMAGGIRSVLFPTEVMADVLPSILGYRFSGPAVVRKMAPAHGDEIATAAVTITDDGGLPGAVGSAPVDDEGARRRETVLVKEGRFAGPLLDTVYAGAVDQAGNGHGLRESIDFPSLARFPVAVGPVPSTIVVAPGSGGTDTELIEVAGDGLWIDQLGYAFPDGVTSAFGGEIRLGYRIRGGKLTEPVRGGTVGGFTLGPAETPPLLASVRSFGSRPTLAGRLSAPTLLVDGFPVASA